MTHIHIFRGVSRRYQARAKMPGGRRYTLIGKPSVSYKATLRRLADAMIEHPYKRGDVLLMADYYDPVPIIEIVR